jgi:CheY-like chemotaxis protein
MSLRKLTCQMLEAQGYTVLEADSGAQALEVAAQHKGMIHLLLTDVVMPGMSGRELASQLVESRPQTRVLFISGYTDNAIVHHGVLDAGVAFLQKPYTPGGLGRKIREVLAGAAPDRGKLQRN